MSDPEQRTTLSDVLVPTTEIPVPEVSDVITFHDSLHAILLSHIPGFVVRSEAVPSLEDPTTNPRGTIPCLMLGILEGSGYLFTEIGIKDGGRLVRQREEDEPIRLGKLHRDEPKDREYFDGQVHCLNVHETIEGKGRATLIETGNERGVLAPPKSEELEVQCAELNGHLQAGMTNPRIFSPRLYTTELSAGDHVVYALDNKRGPVWHRFDTVSLRRVAQARVFKRY